jgi:hypothetical protein
MRSLGTKARRCVAFGVSGMNIEAAVVVTAQEINGLQPSDAMLAGINAPQAHTYILEDAYLNALATGLSNGDLSGLPDTQSEQRDAIIEWRVQLEVLAQQLSLVLPADFQQAGRGEIAPSVSGSS